jgi:hypothetical protein
MWIGAQECTEPGLPSLNNTGMQTHIGCTTETPAKAPRRTCTTAVDGQIKLSGKRQRHPTDPPSTHAHTCTIHQGRYRTTMHRGGLVTQGTRGAQSDKDFSGSSPGHLALIDGPMKCPAHWTQMISCCLHNFLFALYPFPPGSVFDSLRFRGLHSV